MILRARVKAAEELEGIVCCEQMKAALKAFGEREIKVSTSSPLKKTKCQFCHQPFKGMRVHNLRGWRVNPKYWEIEEGQAA